MKQPLQTPLYLPPTTIVAVAVRVVVKAAKVVVAAAVHVAKSVRLQPMPMATRSPKRSSSSIAVRKW